VQKVFLYDPKLIHNTFITDRQTDGRETDDNGTIDAYSMAVIKKVCQKWGWVKCVVRGARTV